MVRSPSLLPNDVLYEIFCRLAVINPATARDIGWIRATHVCRSWREASLRFHRLWARSVCVFPSQVETMLTRAGKAPLYIVEDWRQPGIPTSAVLSLLRDEPSRLASLDIVSRVDLVSSLSGQTYINLVNLRVSHVLNHTQVNTAPIYAPKLKSVSFTNGFVPIIAPHLRTFTVIGSKKSAGHRLSLVLDTLESAPLLSRIEIDGLVNDLPASSNRVVQLANASNVQLSGLDLSYIQHVQVLHQNQGQDIVIREKGHISSFHRVAASIAHTVPHCHNISLVDDGSGEGYTIILQDRMTRVMFTRLYGASQAEIDALQHTITRGIPLDHVRSLNILGNQAVSATFLAAISSTLRLTSTVENNSFLENIPEGALPALRTLVQQSAPPQYTSDGDPASWDRLERFLRARATSGFPLYALKLTGQFLCTDRNRTWRPRSERFQPYVTEVVDEINRRRQQVPRFIATRPDEWI